MVKVVDMDLMFGSSTMQSIVTQGNSFTSNYPYYAWIPGIGFGFFVAFVIISLVLKYATNSDKN